MEMPDWLSRKLSVARETAVSILNGEETIRDGPANLQWGWEAVGGWLAVSPGWLGFSAHGVRISRRAVGLLIPTSSIREVRPCWTRLLGLLPVLPNSIAIETDEERVYRFVVEDRQRWLKVIRRVAASIK
jgi:hypothetical protein